MEEIKHPWNIDPALYPKRQLSPDKQWIAETRYICGWGGFTFTHHWYPVDHPDQEQTRDTNYTENWADGGEDGFKTIEWVPRQPHTLRFNLYEDTKIVCKADCKAPADCKHKERKQVPVFLDLDVSNLADEDVKYFHRPHEKLYPQLQLSEDKKWVVKAVYEEGYDGHSIEYSWYPVDQPELAQSREDLTFVCRGGHCDVGYNRVEWVPGQPARLRFCIDHPELNELSAPVELVVSCLPMS